MNPSFIYSFASNALIKSARQAFAIIHVNPKTVFHGNTFSKIRFTINAFSLIKNKNKKVNFFFTDAYILIWIQCYQPHMQ